MPDTGLWAFPRVSCTITLSKDHSCLLSFMRLESLDWFCEISKVTQPISDSRDSKRDCPSQCACTDLVFPLSFLPSFSCKVGIASDGSVESFMKGLVRPADRQRWPVEKKANIGPVFICSQRVFVYQLYIIYQYFELDHTF